MPVTPDDLARWFAALGAAEAEGSAAFVCDDAIDLALHAEDGETLLFVAGIGEIDGAAPAAALRSLLGASHLGAATAGAALSLAEDGRTVCLWRALPLAGVEPDALTGLLADFLDAARARRAALLDHAPEPADDGTVPPSMVRV